MQFANSSWPDSNVYLLEISNRNPERPCVGGDWPCVESFLLELEFSKPSETGSGNF